jgi:hypothetical protein
MRSDTESTPSVTEVKRTLEWPLGVLKPVTGNVHEGCGRERRRCLLGRGHDPGRSCILDPGLLDNRTDISRLYLDVAESG